MKERYPYFLHYHLEDLQRAAIYDFAKRQAEEGIETPYDKRMITAYESECLTPRLIERYSKIRQVSLAGFIWRPPDNVSYIIQSVHQSA